MRHTEAAIALAATALLISGIDVLVLEDRQVHADPRPTPGATASHGSTPTPSASPSDDPRESVDEQLVRVAAAVSELRELAFEHVPDPTYVTPEELSERAGALADEYTAEDADVDERLLVALGAIAPGTDLRAMLRTALSEHVAGFYDPRTEELVVGNRHDGERLGALDEVTLAHELEHALADQNLGLPFSDGGELPQGQEDEAYAAQALVEGDATLTMIHYAQSELSLLDQAELLEDQAEINEQLANATPLPHFIERSLLFPYQEGSTFVEVLRDDGGWAAVDAAYAAPPVSTLQILQPARFIEGSGAPEEVPPPGELAAPWQQLDTLDVGAADLLFLFEAPGGDPALEVTDALAAAMSWRGGTVDVWADGEASAIGLALRGETGLCAAVGAWYSAAFGPGEGDQARTTFDAAGQDAVLTCVGSDVRLGIAPDLATADLLAS